MSRSAFVVFFQASLYIFSKADISLVWCVNATNNVSEVHNIYLIRCASPSSSVDALRAMPGTLLTEHSIPEPFLNKSGVPRVAER